MKPRTERISHPERPRLVHQDEERGLERVFRLMLVPNDCQAGSPDHRLVPLHQCREGQLGHLARVGRKVLRKLAVRQVTNGPDIVEGPECSQASTW
jgi:hypothetical protein